jgi:hypothetical protein
MSRRSLGTGDVFKCKCLNLSFNYVRIDSLENAARGERGERNSLNVNFNYGPVVPLEDAPKGGALACTRDSGFDTHRRDIALFFAAVISLRKFALQLIQRPRSVRGFAFL